VSEAFNYCPPVAWLLTGPSDLKNLNLALQFSITAGMDAQHVLPGQYRLQGTHAASVKLREWIDTHHHADSIMLRVEKAPDTPSLSFVVKPRNPPRVAELHGAGAPMLARAVDAGLTVRCVGLDRFSVTGETWRQVAWVGCIFGVDWDGALKIMQLTDEQAKAEDRN